MEDEHMIDKNWHLKKELNIGHILTTVLLVLGIIAWGNTMDQRLTAAETRIEHLDGMAAASVLDNKELRGEIITELRQLRSDINALYRQHQDFIISNGRRQDSE